MATTHWRDNHITELNDALELLTDTIEDDRDGVSRKVNWESTKSFENNQNIVINGENIEFNLVRVSYDLIENSIISDGTPSRKSFFVIPYKVNNIIRYIININTGALTVLRRLLSYTGRNEITAITYSFTNDFFTWLINKVYSRNNRIESNAVDGNTWRIDYIMGVKGDTSDLQSKVSATGETVINIISTLAFLLESDHLNEIKLSMSSLVHECVNLTLKNSNITTEQKSYQGEFESYNNDEELARIYLLVYREIIPFLVQSYLDDCENNLWGINCYNHFIRNIAEEIERRIQDLLSIE
jgi:similarity